MTIIINIIILITGIYAFASFISAARRRDGQEAMRGLLALIAYAILAAFTGNL